MAVFTGTAAADVMLQALNADTDDVSGLDGDDTLVGATDDVLKGDAGDDVLVAVVYSSLPVNMTVMGGTGFDVFGLGSDADNNFAADLVAGTVTATSGGQSISVSLNSVEGLRGTSGNDHFLGNAANNVFDTVFGSDTVIGGGGFDVARVSVTLDNLWTRPGVVADLAAGTLAYFGSQSTLASIEGVAGDAFDDRLLGDGGNNRFWPGLGEDQIVGRLGIDTVCYDTMYHYGFDFYGQIEKEVVGGVAVNLTLGRALKPDGAVDVLVSIEKVLGSSGQDTIRGSAASDTLMGGGGADRLFGNDGNDLLLGFHDEVLIYGTHGADGADTLEGGSGSDTLLGGDGDDVLFGGAGNDTVDGGLGYDRVGIRFDDLPRTAGVAFSAAVVGTVDELLFRDGRGGQDLLRSIESADLTGTRFADTLTGSPGDDYIRGAGGDDVLRGGAGFDVAAFDSASGAVQADLVLQSATGAEGTDSLFGFEGLSGGAFGDSLRGNIGHNSLDGMAGNDTLAGLGGDDDLYGGDGNDVLDGGVGNDLLMGGLGNDRLLGSGGNDELWGLGGTDTLTGGLGNDAFYLSEGPYSGTFETIKDFVVGQDRIFLDGLAFDGLGADGTLSSAVFASGAAASTPEQRLVFDEQTGNLYYDGDGSGYGWQELVAVVTVSGGALSAEDFTIFT